VRLIGRHGVAEDAERIGETICEEANVLDTRVRRVEGCEEVGLVPIQLVDVLEREKCMEIAPRAKNAARRDVGLSRDELVP